jgi:hypothetical protein
MSTTTESAQGVTAGTTTEQTTSSWEQAVRRQAAKQRQASEAESTQRSKRLEACRIETLVQNLDAQHTGDLLFRCPPTGTSARAPASSLTLTSLTPTSGTRRARALPW